MKEPLAVSYFKLANFMIWADAEMEAKGILPKPYEPGTKTVNKMNDGSNL